MHSATACMADTRQIQIRPLTFRDSERASLSLRVLLFECGWTSNKQRFLRGQRMDVVIRRYTKTIVKVASTIVAEAGIRDSTTTVQLDIRNLMSFLISLNP